MKIKNKELLRTIKYALFMISAGVIQFVSSTVLKLILDNTVEASEITFIIKFDLATFVADTVGLLLSIIWNFTFNRKYTFKAANNVPVAMSLALLFYVPFYPFQIWYVDMVEKQLESIGFWGYLIGLVTCMIINGVLEFLWQRFVIYRKSVDTNDVAAKQSEKESAVATDENAADEVAENGIAEIGDTSNTETVEQDSAKNADENAKTAE